MSLPALKTMCGQGFGLAVCRSLGLVVTSNVDDNSLSVFALPDTSALDSALLIDGPASSAGGLQLIATLGATSGMHFTFDDTHGFCSSRLGKLIQHEPRGNRGLLRCT